MTFTGKIRIYLISIALLPPLLIMSVIYFRSIRQVESINRQNSFERLQRYHNFERTFHESLEQQLQDYLSQPFIRNALLMVKSGRIRQVDLSARPPGLDFFEIVDTGKVVLVSGHRPGLIGEMLPAAFGPNETVEYDIDGPHAAFAYLLLTPEELGVYAGVYIDQSYREMLTGIMNSEVTLYLPGDSVPPPVMVNGLEQGSLLAYEDVFYALLAGGRKAGFYLVAKFAAGPERPLFMSLLQVAGFVALMAVLAAIAIGMYFTGQAKREIDNLITATSRVASGDFGTPVMAYQEGEFSQLADSFSEMLAKLKEARARLATSEKIAAWQIMGQKIAHEIKNPLTPIAISTDDLLRSYKERLPDFEEGLYETTATIKSEVQRMKILLEQFTGFARMGTPKIVSIGTNKICEGITSLYTHEINVKRLTVTNNSKAGLIDVDPEMVQQLLINLIKNGFEAGPDSRVSLALDDAIDALRITVEDTGPGFAPEILRQPFEPYVSTKKDGSGLGLVICQRIVHDHNGTITLYNRKEGGAVVEIALPL
ncbi:MAG: ATP-binding protein [Candidatus Zixiibacteriota bacterium]|nr:MAG: ATP-binding protein [candidate division Zixibacteria bacterium]